MTKPEPRPGNPFAPPREKLIDRQIREAMNQGKFDNLPYQGERIPLEDESAAGEWGLAYHMLRNARFAPPWIETDKEIRALLGRRDLILARAARSSAIGWRRDEAELREVVTETNRAIFRLNHEAPTHRQQRRPLDLDAELAALDEARRGEGDPDRGTD